MGFNYWNLKSCKPHEKTKQNIKTLDLLVKNWKLGVWCTYFFMWFFHGKFLNFNKWTAKHLEQASCTELTLAQRDEKMTSPMLKDSISLRVYSRASNISIGLNKCVGGNFFEIHVIFFDLKAFNKLAILSKIWQSLRIV